MAVRGMAGCTDEFRLLAPDWPEAAGDGEVDRIEIRRGPATSTIDCTACDMPAQAYADGIELANGVVGTLTACHVARSPELLCLHAAASVIDGGAYALLGDNFAGKSTLAIALAARGLPLFCDDRLLIAPAAEPQVCSLGIAPKLRLPLPASAGPLLRRFVLQHAVWLGEHAAILDGSPVLRAPWGTRRPFAGLLQLDRQEGFEGVTLAALARPAVVRLLLELHFAPHFDTGALLEACVGLAARLPAWRLSYGEMDEAAARLPGLLRAATGQ